MSVHYVCAKFRQGGSRGSGVIGRTGHTREFFIIRIENRRIKSNTWLGSRKLDHLKHVVHSSISLGHTTRLIEIVACVCTVCFSELSLLTQSPTMSQKYTPEIGKQGRADFTPGRADFVPCAAGSQSRNLIGHLREHYLYQIWWIFG